MEHLDEKRMLAGLPADARSRLRSLTVLDEVDSTNRFLLEGEGFAAGVHACVAESQSAGRGRRGREWVSPTGANLYLSVLRVLDATPRSVQGMSLAIGVAVAKALESLGVAGVALKWPNDVLLGGEKLGGILVEIAAGGAGPWRAVAGIGINVDMPRDAGARIDQPWTDLASRGIHPDRNRLASRVLAEVIAAGDRFAETGFEGFRDDWDCRDAVRGRAVEVRDGSSVHAGTARGVDADGALLVEADGGCQRISVGDVSLRLAR
jgi:BirA family biotin operon repressor/biotin-[acetyl-CoA-carboxylase] ligase